MRKVLITGSSGMLGSTINYFFGNNYEIFGFYRSLPNPEIKHQFKVDLTDFKSTQEISKSIDPDVIIHCAALTDVDLCEDHLELARGTNALATMNLLSSFDTGKKFIYISTDSIFDGKIGNYSEEDPPSPLNNYAKTKLEAERFVEIKSTNYIIIRTNIFGWNRVKGESFAEWVYKSLNQNKTISMFTDVIFSPIYVSTLTSLIARLLDLNFTGKINIGSRNPISKYGFGIQLAKRFNFNTSLILPVSVDSFLSKAKRPKNTSLNLNKAESLFGFVPNIEEEIAKFCSQRKPLKIRG